MVYVHVSTATRHRLRHEGAEDAGIAILFILEARRQRGVVVEATISDFLGSVQNKTTRNLRATFFVVEYFHFILRTRDL